MALTKARLIEDNAIKAVHIDETATGITLADLTVTGALNANSGVSGNITGNVTGDVTGDLTGTVLTAAQTNITSVGTLSSLAVSGNLTVDTNTLFVDAANNRVGVGTTPAVELDIYDTYDSQINLTIATHGAAGKIKGDADGLHLYGNGSSDQMRFYTNDAERMRITSSGNVGIGISSPSEKLDVEGNIQAIDSGGVSGAYIDIVSGSTWRFASNPTSGTNSYGLNIIKGSAGTDIKLSINSSGKVGIGNTSPTAQLDVNSGTTNTVAAFRSTDSGAYIGIADPSTTLDAGYPTLSIGAVGNNLTLSTSNAEKMRIDSSGNVGIGTTSTTGTYGKLSIAGGIRILDDNNAKLEIGRYSAGAPNSYIKMGANSNSLRFTDHNDQFDLVTIANNGNVGIGTSSPSSKLDVAGVTTVQRLTAADGGVNIVNIGQNTTAGGYSVVRMLGASNRTSWEIGQNAQILNALSFTPSTALGGSTFTSPTVAFPNTGGITFNGDTAAANALDDYEEGTWTMGISFGGASAGITYGFNTGTYTKIGRQVTVNGYVLLTNKGSSTGAAVITGLPFTIVSGTSYYTASAGYFQNISFANQYMLFGIGSENTIRLREIIEAGTISDLDESNFTNDSGIIVGLTYFV